MVFDRIKKLLKRESDLDIEDFLSNNENTSFTNQFNMQQNITNNPQFPNLNPSGIEENIEKPFVTPPIMPQVAPNQDIEYIKQQIQMISTKLDNLSYKVDMLIQRLNMLEQYFYYRR